jgi:hypothetical protein
MKGKNILESLKAKGECFFSPEKGTVLRSSFWQLMGLKIAQTAVPFLACEKQ